jgi:hypothetical protein
MREPGLTDYLQTQQRYARRNLTFTRWMWRARPLLMLLHACVMPFVILTGNKPGKAIFALVFAGFGFVMLGFALYSQWLAPVRLDQVLDRAGAEIRHNLMERGLLLQVMDPGYTLTARSPGFLSLSSALRPFPNGTDSRLRDRLNAFAYNYLACCKQADITSPLAERTMREGGRYGEELLRSVVMNQLAEILDTDSELGSQLSSVDGVVLNRGSTSDW